MQTLKTDDVREFVRQTYAAVAEGRTSSCCSPSDPSCCG